MFALYVNERFNIKINEMKLQLHLIYFSNNIAVDPRLISFANLSS